MKRRGPQPTVDKPTYPLAPEFEDDPAAPPEIAGHALQGVLGRGGMGVVYQAHHLRLKRDVAVKMILLGSQAGPKELARFRAEAEALARLQHPNIVQIHEVGEAAGVPYFSLEYLNGGSLADQLDGSPWPVRKAARLVRTLARALHHAHERGIVHRDLKPSNVLFTNDGTPKIVDFGLAKLLGGGEGLTPSDAIMGTPSYMAPEQAGGQSKHVGPAADVYALGSVLYELLTGRRAFAAATHQETILKVVSEEPVPPRLWRPNLSRDLETICLRCLQKEPNLRYRSAQALADDLRRFLTDRPIRAKPSTPWTTAIKWARRNRAVAIMLVVLLAALLVSSLAELVFQLLKH
jgi:serine/threonine-protein kinase